MTVERVQSGVNFTNMLQPAFASKDPKSAKGTDDLTVFLHFLEYVHVKAMSTHVGEIDPRFQRLK